jgi:hypothetical protein
MRIAALTEERNLGPSLEHPTGMARGNSSTTRSRHLGPISEAFFAHLASSEEGADGSPQSQLNYGSSLTELEPGRPPVLSFPGARTLPPLPSAGSLYRATSGAMRLAKMVWHPSGSVAKPGALWSVMS